MDLARTCCSLLAVGTLAFGASAGVVHDEALDGDLSNSAGAPTALLFQTGTNTVIGTVDNGSADQRDYLTFSLPAGSTLVALNLVSYKAQPSGDPGNLGFHAINAGNTSFVPSMATAGSFLGGDHIGAFQEGTDVLPNLAAATLAGTGFTVPLGEGAYSYLIQQTSDDLTGYELEFVVESVWSDEGCALAGVSGEPQLTGTGELSSGSNNLVVLSNAAPLAFSGVFVSLGSTPANFKGGTLKAFPFSLLLFVNTNAGGGRSVPFVMPDGLPSGAELYLQWAIQDAAAVAGVSLSNALEGTTP